MKNIYVFLIISAFFFGSEVSTADAQGPGRGRISLPPVNIDAVADDAFEPGVIQVMFSEQMADKLTSTIIRRGPTNQVALANANIDNINRRFAVREYKALLHDMYERGQVAESKRMRHREYGFNLMYEISLGDGMDVKEAVREFSKLPEVAFAEPVYRKVRIDPVSVSNASPFSTGGSTTITSTEWKPADTYYGVQYALKNTGQSVNGTTGTAGADISAEKAWGIIKGNPDVIVAVIDEGVQYNHPDLAANMWPGIGIEGTSTIAGGHGTHVAGTIAAVSNNNAGVAGVAGGDGSAGSGVKIMSLDMFNGAYKGKVYALNVYAADNGAAISQNSWGYTSVGVYNTSDLMGIDYFNTHGGGGILQGGVSIFAAGNNNSSGNWYPAYYSGAFSVASTTNRDLKSSFSNYGTWIDVSAPGTDIASTYTGSGYVYMSGTSMACPHVSGVAALVLSLAPGTMTNAQLLDLLRSTTDNIDAKNPSYAGLLGTGRVNAYSALLAAAAYAGGVAAPVSLTANALSDSEIALAWQSNASSDAVLLIYSDNNVFGTPAAGVTYTPGQTLPGGGTVLYSGSGQNSMNHTGLNAVTTYYYRIWAYDAEVTYSLPKNAKAATLCPPFQPLPFEENFNGMTALPACWSTSGSKLWSVGTFSSGISGTGNYAWTETTGRTATTALLLSPAFDFTGLTDVRLQFTHRYNHNLSTANLAYSVNNGGTWTTLQNWTANTGTVNYNQVIAALAGQSVVIFRWTLTYNGGGTSTSRRSWSVDNVQVSASLPAVQYSIAASAGAGGSISPSGTVQVTQGGNQTFTVTPSAGYEISDVVVNGSGVGAVSSYTFTNVQANQTIAAYFSAIPKYYITATSGPNGSVTPSGTTEVLRGGSLTYNITASAGYEVDDVLVDESSIGAVSSYTFTNVTVNHTIEATFKAIPKYSISATSGPNGSVTPEGITEVLRGGSVSYTITAAAGYEVDDVLVDGSSIGAVNSYTFTNITENHAISATFAEVTVDPCTIAMLPYLQDFNVTGLPACWSTVVHTGNVPWSVGRVSSGGLNLNTGNYAYAVFSGTTLRKSDLISQPFDFSGYTGLSMTFRHYYRHSNSSARVYYSLNGGATWTQLQSWTKTTSNPATATISLTALNGKQDVVFKWELNYTGGGNSSTVRSWFVEDVRISATGTSSVAMLKSAITGIDPETEIVNDPEMKVYPVPATERVFVTLSQDAENADIRILDMQGRTLRSMQAVSFRAGEPFVADIKGISPGIYIVSVTGASFRLTERITVQP